MHNSADFRYGFRNVIFINGVPQELIDAPDNDKINPLGADRFRFVMHLHEGKAHYVNEISGVYRILKKRAYIQAQVLLKNMYAKPMLM